MARSTPTISVTGIDQMAAAIKQHDQVVKRRIAFEFIKAEPEAETYAKVNAPWTDRSGNARSGLTAKAQAINGGETVELVLAGSVFYQIFLETRFSGKYAILMPTVNHMGNILMARISKALQEMEVAS